MGHSTPHLPPYLLHANAILFNTEIEAIKRSTLTTEAKPKRKAKERVAVA